MNIAETILAQLGGNRFRTMTGARDFLADDDTLQFRLGRAKSGINRVRVTLNPRDLYDMQFYAIRGANVSTIAVCGDLYADQLAPMFTRVTGLATSL